jgi:hypothetical protein
MEPVAIIARLKEGSEPRAAELVAAGPPLDPAETGILRHSIYISSSEAVFVFEGHEVQHASCPVVIVHGHTGTNGARE